MPYVAWLREADVTRDSASTRRSVSESPDAWQHISMSEHALSAESRGGVPELQLSGRSDAQIFLWLLLLRSA